MRTLRTGGLTKPYRARTVFRPRRISAVPDPQLAHRLAAILSADAVGYTRLLAEDEPATIRALGAARDLFTAGVTEHRGRIVDSPGDNVLAEFSSALDSLRCAVALQRTLTDRAAPLRGDRRLLYRIGLHLGDVAVEGERIYGDGVNVAARLQALAEPGGVCLSAALRDSIQGRVDLPFVDLGDQSLKNFPRPVRAFRIGRDKSVAPTTPRFEAIDDRPSLVVLPFANVSGDAEQEYFADGMSEDLIAELARIPGLFVIGRGTSFAYKGKNVSARELGRELGVKHVIEGSVRRAGARVRITARLTEAHSARETWSERYDRELGDVFALQDEVVGGIVVELRKALGAVIEHTPRGRPVRPEVWALMVQGRVQTGLNTVPGGLAARELLQRCVSLDPEFALGWAELALAERLLHLLNADGEYLEEGFVHARRALELDPEEPIAHIGLAHLLARSGDEQAAIVAGRRAVELAPSDASLRLEFGQLLVALGHADEAIQELKGLTRLDPALRPMHLFQIALCYRRLGRTDEAIAKHLECVQVNPDFFGAHMQLAAIYASLGDLNHARAPLAELMRIRPDFSVAKIPRVSRREFLVENLRKAGLRE